MMLSQLRRLKSNVSNAIASFGTTPAWTSASEQNFLRSYARSEYTGRGEIVDLGCLFGATTIALARGLRGNRSVSAKECRIHSFDWFRWEDAFKNYPGKLDCSYQPGESFYPDFLRNIRAFQRYVAPYPFDLTKQGWPGGDIEFLIADSTKSFELCERIFDSFYTQLIPGVSLVLEQDFVHWWAPWIHLASFRLRKSLKPIGLIPGTTSVTFKSISQIDPALVTRAQLQNCSEEEVREAFDYCLTLMPDTKGWERASVLAAKVTYFTHLGQLERARALLDVFRADGYTFESDLARAQWWLEVAEKQSPQ